MNDRFKTEFVRKSKRFKAKYFKVLGELFAHKDIKDDETKEVSGATEVNVAGNKSKNTNRVL
jgi:hypothetical protein